MEIGQKENKSKGNSIITKPNSNFINGIEVVNSKETNLVKQKNDKINEQLKNLKEEDLEDLPDLEWIIFFLKLLIKYPF